MRQLTGELLLLSLILVAAGIGVWARANPSITVVAALIAILAGATLGVLELWPAARSEPPPRTRTGRPSIPVLVDAFHSGELGRDRIIGALERLRRDTEPGSSSRLSRAESSRLRRASRAEFEEWVRRRIEEIEALT